jgi:hypothetical protein
MSFANTFCAFCNRRKSFCNLRNSICNRCNSFRDCEDRSISRERFTSARNVSRTRFRDKDERSLFSFVWTFTTFLVIFESDREDRVYLHIISSIKETWSRKSFTSFTNAERKKSMTLNMMITINRENNESRIVNTKILWCIYDAFRSFYERRDDFTKETKIQNKVDHVMSNCKENFFARNESRSCCLSSASVNERIAIQSSSYELSWTTFTDISSYTTSNELRVTMSEILLREIRFWFSR